MVISMRRVNGREPVWWGGGRHSATTCSASRHVEGLASKTLTDRLSIRGGVSLAGGPAALPPAAL